LCPPAEFIDFLFGRATQLNQKSKTKLKKKTGIWKHKTKRRTWENAHGGGTLLAPLKHNLQQTFTTVNWQQSRPAKGAYDGQRGDRPEIKDTGHPMRPQRHRRF